MAEVHAIKSVEDIERVQDFLQKHYGTHYEDLWVLGINLALRISDLLQLTHSDCEEALKEGAFIIRERKTATKSGKKTKKKPRIIALNNIARSVVLRRLDENPEDIYLFQTHSRNVKTIKPLSRQAVYDAFREAGRAIDRSMGTHTMRKTRGYMMLKGGIHITEISKVLHHSDTATTMRYIGLEQENINQTYHDFQLGKIR